MELNCCDGLARVFNGHDDLVVGLRCYPEISRKRVALGMQGVLAPDDYRRIQAFEQQGIARDRYGGRFAVNRHIQLA